MGCRTSHMSEAHLLAALHQKIHVHFTSLTAWAAYRQAGVNRAGHQRGLVAGVPEQAPVQQLLNRHGLPLLLQHGLPVRLEAPSGGCHL